MMQNGTASGAQKDGGLQTSDMAVQSDGRQANTALLSSLLGESKRTEFMKLLERLGVPQELSQAVGTGQLTAGAVLEQIGQWIKKDGIGRQAARELFGSDGMKTLLQEQLEEQFLLRPGQVADKEEMSRFYSRLQEQTTRLAQALSQAGAEQTSLGKSVNNMRESVDFLNQLNQNYTYVQLPLKLTGQKAHGDLYVYTNKKNLAQKDGSVSALLHLDMEHMGSVDVYVAMTQERVSTKFYLEREELLDFLEQHMHLLNERLNQKGYHLSTEVCHREQPAKIVDELLKQEGGTSVLAQYSFDVRA